ncbi:MAG: hypothetical protein AMXMBFR59_40320 [Rhodanobacteraceae bacterium]
MSLVKPEINAMSSHHDWVLGVSAQRDVFKWFARESGEPLRFRVRDAVIHTNSYGGQFRRRVIKVYRHTGSYGR